MKIAFLPAATEELTEVADYYEARLSGLGSDFLLEVERLAAVVLELPTLGEKLDRVHRRVSLRRFPYGLVFFQDEDVILSSP
jgi:hypothetical protein